MAAPFIALAIMGAAFALGAAWGRSRGRRIGGMPSPLRSSLRDTTSRCYAQLLMVESFSCQSACWACCFR